METKNETGVVLNDSPSFYAVHPGSILGEELKSRGIKHKDFARTIGMEASHLSALIHGTRNVSAGIASRLEAGLGIPASLWLNLQSQYNLDKQRLETRRLSAKVDGYGAKPASASFLSEPKPTSFGDRNAFRITIPSSDYEFLKKLSEGMGWEISEEHTSI